MYNRAREQSEGDEERVEMIISFSHHQHLYTVAAIKEQNSFKILWPSLGENFLEKIFFKSKNNVFLIKAPQLWTQSQW